MSGYAKEVTREIEVDGKKLLVKFKRLKRRDSKRLLPEMLKVKQKVEEFGKESAQAIEAVYGMLEAAEPIVRDYIVEVSGLPEGAGVGELVEDEAFSKHFSAVVEAIFEAGKLSEEERGN